MGGVAVFLVATDAARSIKFSRVGLIVLFGACAVSLATNIAQLRDGTATFRAYSDMVRADLAMVELARTHVDPSFDPLDNVRTLFFQSNSAGRYLAVVDQYGSPAFSLEELERGQVIPRTCASERFPGDAGAA